MMRDADDQDYTRRIDYPPSEHAETDAYPPDAASRAPTPGEEAYGAHGYAQAAGAYAPESPGQENVLYVPLAVTVGDGFKFGCGFFLAFVIAMLVGFVLLAALFALAGLMGVNLLAGR